MSGENHICKEIDIVEYTDYYIELQGELENKLN